MAILDDFTIFPFSKVIRHTSGTTVYSMIAFYSYLMDTFDEPAYLSYEAPMKFQTPTLFNMLNGWFLDNGDGSDALQYLTGGSLTTIDYTSVADPVYMLDIDDTGVSFVNWVAGDLDLPIVDDAVPVGPLLSFKTAYPVADSARLWFRDTRTTPAAVADDSVITTTGGTGAGQGNGASLNGDEVYTNLFTIASFPGTPNPQVYVYQLHPMASIAATPVWVQERVRIAEWSGLTNWDRGSIDILVPVKLGGVEIDSGNVTSVVRQTADSYTFVESDLTTGDRTPIATETLTDAVNVTVGEHFLAYDNSNTGSFSVGDIVMNQSDAPNATPPTFYFEVVAVQENALPAAAGSTGTLTIRGLRGTISDTNALFVGTVQEALANGEPGDTYIGYDGSTVDPVAGDINKVILGSVSAFERELVGFQVFTAVTDGALICRVHQFDTTLDTVVYGTGSLRDPLYAVPVDNDIVTRHNTGTMSVTAGVVDSLANQVLISGFTDITVAHVSGRITTSGVAGTFLVGERVTWNTAGSNAIFLGYETEFTEMYLGNVDPLDEPDAADVLVGSVSAATINVDSGLTDDNTMGFAFTQQSTFQYSIVVEGGTLYTAGRTLTDIYAFLQFYLRDGQSTGQVYTLDTPSVRNPANIHTSDTTAITLVAAEEYLRGDPAYLFTKPAPYGTKAGTLFFGAQGVWVTGQSSLDDNNLRLTDDVGTAQTPFTSVVLTVSNTRASDVVSVMRDDGAGLPLKTQFTSHASANTTSLSTFQVSATLPTDTPSSGVLFVVDNASNMEHRYRYDSFATDTFTLAAEVTGTATGGSALNALEDTGSPFTAGVQRGDIIRKVTPAVKYGYIVSVDGNDDVTTTNMTDADGTSNAVAWATSDTFEINSLVKVANYDASDTVFVPYLDAIEDTGTDGVPGTITQTILYLSDRTVVVRARNNLGATELVPFVASNTITDTGMSQAVIRTEDTVTT